MHVLRRGDDAVNREDAEKTFPIDACERLTRANYDYTSTHGDYIRPLAFLLNATRVERGEARVERDLYETMTKEVERALFGTDMGRSRDEIVERAEKLAAEIELARQRAMLILRIARQTWEDPKERLSKIEGEAEHFYFIATGRECDGSPACKADRHVHGCFADRGDCDHPSEHAREGVR